MDTIRELMEEETWFSCDRALEYGFVDKQMLLRKFLVKWLLVFSNMSQSKDDTCLWKM